MIAPPNAAATLNSLVSQRADQSKIMPTVPKLIAAIVPNIKESLEGILASMASLIGSKQTTLFTTKKIMLINDDTETKRIEISGFSMKFISMPPNTEPDRPPMENEA